MQSDCKLSFPPNAISSSQDSSSDTTFPGASWHGGNSEPGKAIACMQDGITSCQVILLRKERNPSSNQVPSIKNDHPDLFHPVSDQLPSHATNARLETCPPSGEPGVFGYPKDKEENLKNKNAFKQDLLFFDLKYRSVAAISNTLFCCCWSTGFILHCKNDLCFITSSPNQALSQGETVPEEQECPEGDPSCTHLRGTGLHCSALLAVQ